MDGTAVIALFVVALFVVGVLLATLASGLGRHLARQARVDAQARAMQVDRIRIETDARVSDITRSAVTDMLAEARRQQHG